MANGDPTRSFWKTIVAIIVLVAVGILIWAFYPTLRQALSPKEPEPKTAKMVKKNPVIKKDVLLQVQKVFTADTSVTESWKNEREELLSQVNNLRDSLDSLKNHAPLPIAKEKRMKKALSKRRISKRCECPSNYWRQYWTVRR